LANGNTALRVASRGKKEDERKKRKKRKKHEEEKGKE